MLPGKIAEKDENIASLIEVTMKSSGSATLSPSKQALTMKPLDPKP